MVKASRQPSHGEITLGSSTSSEPPAPSAAPIQNAVDREIGPAAAARRDQFVDRRIDRRVFAADARAGGETEQREGPEAPG